MSTQSSGYARLDDQIAWHDRASRHHRLWYRRLKFTSIAMAALVPLVSGLGGMALVIGRLGFGVAQSAHPE